MFTLCSDGRFAFTISQEQRLKRWQPWQLWFWALTQQAGTEPTPQLRSSESSLSHVLETAGHTSTLEATEKCAALAAAIEGKTNYKKL